MVEPFAQFTDVHRGELGDILIPDFIRQGFTVQTLTVALWAFTLCQELISPFLTCCGVVVVHHVAQVFDDTVE